MINIDVINNPWEYVRPIDDTSEPLFVYTDYTGNIVSDYTHTVNDVN